MHELKCIFENGLRTVSDCYLYTFRPKRIENPYLVLCVFYEVDLNVGIAGYIGAEYRISTEKIMVTRRNQDYQSEQDYVIHYFSIAGLF